MKIWARWLTYICRLYFLQNASRDRNLLRKSILLSENIPIIVAANHQQTQGYRDRDWNDKNDNANYAPRITWKVLPMAQVAIFKEIFDQVRKDLDCELFYSELKRHNVSIHYIYYLATDNIHIVLER